MTDQKIPEDDLRRCCVSMLRDVPEIKLLVVQKNKHETKKNHTGERLFSTAFYYHHHYNLASLLMSHTF